MQLMRLGETGRERPAVRDDTGAIRDLTPVTRDIDGAFLADGGISRVRRALEAGTLPLLPDADRLRVGAPVARPTAVVCIGQNYAAHAAESGSEPPTAPILFFKHPNTIVGPYDDVLLPPGAEKVDWEVELAVVIGRPARYLSSAAEAAACIAGYAISHDVSERTYQLAESGGQWSKGKSCETFNPLGPWLVPANELPCGPQDLTLRSRVNGEPRQNSSTADMIFGVQELVWHLSHYLTLDPGDVINTGTPQGVALSGRFPYLKAGDIVELEIDRLGHQRQTLRDARVG
ncbi:2-keto-4-pentenoate hydratase/2-oxohepta-3-ene-1,7-dioic acid hydratase (catechol pathway) [Saccharopolyspora shandongensis]|uniref:2-keto-4-pentenoate hydratase/2-oxohepta-3-ene-1,7-dioic acid hydratase (Catechol pathway) n=1 Tax=Saccharopolyspora shandongensis TaxID=418495 RepID=A0A1H3NDE7_9PSEU|nr:fumarylacetoacetate hydrolase family protein [Saccharopolyspora shandongensis]SDY86916.1 2-keto-4-pentenoate hydratase/2-oxohepta-3-ene-1,7-dioic acid hydratase (catechol pathway) [Saccharopolyspora shandongensis]